MGDGRNAHPLLLPLLNRLPPLGYHYHSEKLRSDHRCLIILVAHIEPVNFNKTESTPLLTRCHEDVVRLVADGLKNPEIAEILKVSEQSIRNYLYRIFDKL